MNTGKREYSCSRNSAISSPSVALSRMATMSGRGVMISRTSVPPKSMMFCSSWRSSPEMTPSCAPGSGAVAAASPASDASSCASGAAGRLPACSTREIHFINGARARAIGLNVGSSQSSTFSGSRPTISIGSTSSNKPTNAAPLPMTIANRGAPWNPIWMPISVVAATVTRPSSRRTGANSRIGSSRYPASESGLSLRSACRRSDRRISTENAEPMQPR